MFKIFGADIDFVIGAVSQYYFEKIFNKVMKLLLFFFHIA